MMTVMHRYSFLIFILFSTLTMAQQTTPKSAFLEKWDNSRDYILAIAASMPEESFSFKPIPREMSFMEQLVHIGENIDWISSKYFDAQKRSDSDLESDKQRTIANLTMSFKHSRIAIENTDKDDLKDIVGFFAGPKSKLQLLNLLQDHVTHHRGQLIVYLNLKEIDPPSYVGW